MPLTAVPISRIFKTTDFGYQTITVEHPLLDEYGQPQLETKANGKARGYRRRALRAESRRELDEIDTELKGVTDRIVEMIGELSQ